MEAAQEVEDGFVPDETEQGADASLEEESTEVDAEVEETEEQESEAESPPADDENVEKKTDAFQERIDKLTSSFRESEREAEALRQRLEDAEKRLAEVPPEPHKTLADFEFDEDKYRDYLFTEAESRAERAAERVVRGFQEKVTVESSVEKFAAREREFSKSVADYETVAHAPDVKINSAMAVEIRESEIGPEMAYYLGKHPEEAALISRKSPREVIKEMTILESKLRAEKGKATGKKVSDAPPPPAKIRGKDAGIRVSTTDPKSDNMSDDEWFKAEEKRKVKLRG